MKTKRTFELAMSFWLGVGLMSIINILKISQSQNPVRYSLIMFSVSLLFLVICLICLIVINKRKK